MPILNIDVPSIGGMQLRKKQEEGQIDPRKICSLFDVFKMKQNKELNKLWKNSKEYRKKVLDYFDKRYNNLTRKDYALIVL